MASTTTNLVTHSREDPSSSEYDAKSELEDLEYTLECISNVYSEREGDGMEQISVYERSGQIREWRDWYIEKYPHTPPQRLAAEHGEDVDIRVLFMAYPTAAYSILLFLEACYEVDKAICGLDTIAFATIKQWHLPQDMSAYHYLLSDEMVLWWKRELCELNDEIYSRASNRVSISLRVRGLTHALAKLDRVVDCGTGIGDTIGTRIWTYSDESDYDDIPSGLPEAIYGRKELLEDSIKILRKGLKKSEPREDNAKPVVRAVSGGTEVEGLRQRIPRKSSSEVTQELLQPASPSVVSHREVPQNPNTASVFDHQFQKGTTVSGASRYMKLLIERTTDWLQLAKKFIGWRKLVEFLVHAETSLVIFSISVAASAILMAISITRASSPVAKVGQISLGSDPNFFANVSQAVLSVLSIYLIILPIARSRSLGLRYRFWFWGCLFISALSSILSLGLYSLYPVASGVLGWTGTFAQVAITLLLTRSIEEASKAGSIDSIELHVH